MKNKFFALHIYTNLVYMFTLSLARQMRFGGCTRNLRRLDQSVWLFSIRKASCKLIDRRSSDDGIEKRTSRNSAKSFDTLLLGSSFTERKHHTHAARLLYIFKRVTSPTRFRFCANELRHMNNNPRDIDSRFGRYIYCRIKILMIKATAFVVRE